MLPRNKREIERRAFESHIDKDLTNGTMSVENYSWLVSNNKGRSAFLKLSQGKNESKNNRKQSVGCLQIKVGRGGGDLRSPG